MEQMREKMKQEAIAETKQTTKGKESGEEQSDDWTEDQTQLLIKAVNLFPAGTASRYSKNTVRCITQPVVFFWIVERASPQWRKEKKERIDCEQPLLVRVCLSTVGLLQQPAMYH